MEWEDYWRKAHENLTVADWAYQNGKHNASASRAYYAVFLASIAALLKLTDYRMRKNQWDHDQVQAELNLRLITRRKVLPAALGRIPMDLIVLRHQADYKAQPVSAKAAKAAVEQAREFLAAIASALGATV